MAPGWQALAARGELLYKPPVQQGGGCGNDHGHGNSYNHDYRYPR